MQSSNPRVFGLAEIYSTPIDSFYEGARFGSLHPIHIEAALTDLEQDVEAELQRRGHEARQAVFTLGSRTKAGSWATKRINYVPNKQDLELPIEVIVDRIESEIAK